MRALLYIAQQVGRPLSEADVRRLAAVPAAGLDESAFLTAGARLGLETHALDLTPERLGELPMPFAVVAAGRPAHVVVTGKGGRWVVLDVVEGRAWRLSTDEVMALGTRALVMREQRPDERREAWYAPLWLRVRPVILKLAAASFVINVLGLATPLFMMLVLYMVIGRGPSTGGASVMAVLCAGMLIAYGLDFALRVMRGWLSARPGGRLATLVGAQGLHHLVQLPPPHFQRTPAGGICRRLRQPLCRPGFLPRP